MGWIMGLKSCYSISKNLLKTWYNTVGIDFEEVNFDNIDTSSISDLYYVSPTYMFESLIPNARAIDEQYKIFVERVCEICGIYHTPKDEELQEDYERAYIGILKAVTNLNLIPEDSENYILQYLRLDTIILLALQLMNNMSIEEIIEFFSLIETEQYYEILKRCKKYDYLSMLVYLAIHSNDAVPDYVMFKDATSHEISTDNFCKLFADSINGSRDYDVTETQFNLPDKCRSGNQIIAFLEHLSMPFERVSFSKVLKLMNKQNN